MNVLPLLHLRRWAALLGAILIAITAPAAERPNIVLIMTDDQGYGDLGATGNPVIHTPNLDALAARSASMSRFYVSPVCAPTRASLMTGRYNYRTRVVDTFKGRSMMEPDEFTLAEALQQAGYTTGIFGKWHLGDAHPMRPNDQGFDESLVHRGGGLGQPSEPIDNARRYTDPVLFHNGRRVETTGYCTDVYFDAALEFVDRAVAADKPFFLYLTPNAPHGPYHDVPEALYQKYKNMDLSPVFVGNDRDADRLARIFAMIENIDQNVGRLQAKLGAAGVVRNTIVIFMVDNGPNTRRYVGALRGMKSEVHEGGIRSPFYVQWPARLKANHSNDRIAAHIDVMPTLLDAAGVAAPDNLDGRSMLPLLEGRAVDWPDRQIVIQTHRGNEPQRWHHFALIEQRWKLVHPTGFGRETMPEEVPFELYDLVADPGESNDLAAERPEKVAELKAAYSAWFDDVSSTRPDNFAPPRIVVGSDRETVTALTWENWRPRIAQGWGGNGRWLLNFIGDHRYDAELAWPKPIQPTTLTLRMGSVERVTPVPIATDRVLLRDIVPPSGPVELSVSFVEDGEPGSPYHVILHRRE